MNWVDTLSRMLEKLTSFFDVFDLSFFVAGCFGLLGGLVLLLVQSGDPVWWLKLVSSSTPHVVVAVVVFSLLAYLFGLVCFVLGRWIRVRLCGPWSGAAPRDDCALDFPPEGKTQPPAGRPQLGWVMATTLLRHHLEQDPRFTSYFEPIRERRLSAEQQRGFAQLYSRLWVDLRHQPDLAPSYKLVQSYWVRAAVFDGLVVAFLVWAAVGAILLPLHAEHPFPPLAATLLLCGAAIWLCMYEALRLTRYQLEELVCTVAWQRDRRLSAERSRLELVDWAVAGQVDELARQGRQKAEERWLEELPLRQPVQAAEAGGSSPVELSAPQLETAARRQLLLARERTLRAAQAAASRVLQLQALQQLAGPPATDEAAATQEIKLPPPDPVELIARDPALQAVLGELSKKLSSAGGSTPPR